MNEQIRSNFPLLNKQLNDKPIIYLDNAATTQKPKQVIQTITKFYEEENANIHRGIYKLSENATNAYDHARAVVANFISAKHEEIIFTRGTTESLNLLSYTVQPLLKGSEIILTELEHHANLIPWQQLAKKHNLKLKFIKLKENYELDYDQAKELITDETALVAMPHISNALGTIVDVKQLCSLAKKHNAISIVDAAQSVPHMKVDIAEIGCDFLAFSGHKMCGPTGIGVLFGRKDLLEQMPPFHTGGDMIETATYEDATWNILPTKFEAGTPNIAGALGLAAAVEYLENVGLENIHNHEQQLTVYALEKLNELNGINIHRADNAAGIISFTIENAHVHDVCALLDDDNVCIRGGHHCAMPLMTKLNIPGTARISFYLYNTKQDVDVMITALKGALDVVRELQ